MRRNLLLGLGVVVLAASAFGQSAQPDPVKFAATTGPVAGIEKFRYYMRHLDLDPEQTRHVEGLIEVYLVEKQEAEMNWGKNYEVLKDIYAKLDEAQRKNEREKVAQLQEAIRRMSPGVEAEENFFRGLIHILSPGKQAVLERTRQRLTSNPEGTLRPMEVLAIAREQTLSPEQMSKLADVQRSFRTRVNQMTTFDDAARVAELDKLIADVRAVLTKEQAAVFETQVGLLKSANPNSPKVGAATPMPNQPTPMVKPVPPPTTKP